MDKLEYIPGALVMTNGVPLGTAKDVVYRVTSSDPTKTLELDDGTVLKGVVCLENIEGAELGEKGYLFGDCCAWVKDIVPINIVPAILEKNGWSREDGVFGVSHDFKKVIDDPARKKGYITCLSIYPFFNNDGFSFFYNNQKLAIIHYIHELQHILYGLKINSEMKV